MTELRFNPYYSLPPYTEPEDGPSFPFEEGECVTMNVVFGSPVITVLEERALREDLQGIEARLEVRLHPYGKDMGDYMLSEITTAASQPRSHQLRFPYDLEDVLQAILTDSDAERDFPFQLGEILNVPLMVKRVEMMDPPSVSIGDSWRALLVPLGRRSGNLIATEVSKVDGTSSQVGPALAIH